MLLALEPIQGLHIEQRQTGTDSADTYCELTGSGPKVSGWWRMFARYLEVAPDHNTVARVLPRWRTKADERATFERRNASEYAEYLRLHAKFGDVDDHK